jgi:hypothetical protein
MSAGWDLALSSLCDRDLDLSPSGDERRDIVKPLLVIVDLAVTGGGPCRTDKGADANISFTLRRFADRSGDNAPRRLILSGVLPREAICGIATDAGADTNAFPCTIGTAAAVRSSPILSGDLLRAGICIMTEVGSGTVGEYTRPPAATPETDPPAADNAGSLTDSGECDRRLCT